MTFCCVGATIWQDNTFSKVKMVVKIFFLDFWMLFNFFLVLEKENPKFYHHIQNLLEEGRKLEIMDVSFSIHLPQTVSKSSIQ